MLCKCCSEVAVSPQGLWSSGSCGIQVQLGCGRGTVLQVAVDTCLVGASGLELCQFSPKHVAAGRVPCPRKSAVLRSWQHVVLWLPSLPIRFVCWLFQQSVSSQSLLIV